MTAVMADLAKNGAKRRSAKRTEEEQGGRLSVIKLLRGAVVHKHGCLASAHSFCIGPGLLAEILGIFDPDYPLAWVPRRATQHSSLAATDICENVRGLQRKLLKDPVNDRVVDRGVMAGIWLVDLDDTSCRYAELGLPAEIIEAFEDQLPSPQHNTLRSAPGAV